MWGDKVVMDATGWRGAARGCGRAGGVVCGVARGCVRAGEEGMCAGWRGAVERRGDLGDGPVEQHAQGHGRAVGQREGGEVRPHCQVGPALAADVEAEVEASAARTAAEDRLRNTCTCHVSMCMCMCTCMCMCICMCMCMCMCMLHVHVHVHVML